QVNSDGRLYYQLRNLQQSFSRAFFFFRLHRCQNQFRKQIQTANAVVLECISLAGKSFNESESAIFPCKRHSDHGASAEPPGGLNVYTRIILCVVTTYDLTRAETCSGEP